MHDRKDIDSSLREVLNGTDGLEKLLERSLGTAADRAPRELDDSLVQALAWPRSTEEYVDYLTEFARWVPRQSKAAAWTGGSAHQQNADEVSERLSHFFWLIDQKVRDDGSGVVEGSPELRSWLTRFAQSWGSFLDTPQSFDQDVLDSFVQDAPQYTVQESLVGGRPNSPSGWQTFNQFFARELNPGRRPITEPASNLVVSCPADCSYEQTFGIGADSAIPATRIKATATYGAIPDLLTDSPYAEQFAGGTFVHYMLPPSAYHRFHTPVAGRVAESRVVNGQVYMQVQVSQGRFDSTDRTRSGYEFFQTRGVFVLDTADSPGGDVGLVGVVPVGMSHVASVALTATEGTDLAKGDEFGYFQFGGSDIILLFQEGVQVDVDTSGDFRHVGTPAARLQRAG